MRKFLPFVMILVLVVVTNTLFAQGGPPPPPPSGGPPPPAIPIDGGVLALLASGIAYGVKKLYNKG